MITQTVVLSQQRELCAMLWGKGQESLKLNFAKIYVRRESVKDWFGTRLLQAEGVSLTVK